MPFDCQVEDLTKEGLIMPIETYWDMQDRAEASGDSIELADIGMAGEKDLLPRL